MNLSAPPLFANPFRVKQVIVMHRDASGNIKGISKGNTRKSTTKHTVNCFILFSYVTFCMYVLISPTMGKALRHPNSRAVASRQLNYSQPHS